MKRIQNSIFLLIFISLIAGCGPVYKREYAFVPPQSNSGKICIAQCVSSKSSCQQMCKMNVDNCQLRARQNAIDEYREYKHERKHEGKEVDKTVSDFDHSSSCSSSCNCEPAFRECYSACGGEVLQRDVCVAFCDKK